LGEEWMGKGREEERGRGFRKGREKKRKGKGGL